MSYPWDDSFCFPTRKAVSGLLRGTPEKVSHVNLGFQPFAWDGVFVYPTGSHELGGIGGKAEKRPFFIPPIAAKISVHVGIVLKNGSCNYGMYAGRAMPTDWFY